MSSDLWIVRNGWRIVKILSSVGEPKIEIGSDEALFEVPAELEAVVGNDVRWFEDSGRRKPLSKLVAEGLVAVPEGFELEGEAFRMRPEVRSRGLRRVWAEVKAFAARLRWIGTGR